MTFSVLKIPLNVKCYKFEYHRHKNIPNCFLTYLLIVFVASCLPSCKNRLLLINEVTDSGKEDETLTNHIGWQGRHFEIPTNVHTYVSKLGRIPLYSILRALNKMEAKQRDTTMNSEGNTVIPLFASFQDYLSNDQEIREVSFSKVSLSQGTLMFNFILWKSVVS